MGLPHEGRRHERGGATSVLSTVSLGLLLAMGVSGCIGQVPPLAAAEGVASVASGRPLTDHIISFASGKNCSIKRIHMGLTYCVEDEPNPSPNVYCYRTLGEITCYDHPDPYRDGQPRVGNNSQNLKGGF